MRFPNPINFLKALLKLAKRQELTPKPIEEKRQKICDACEHNEHNQCQVCTCFIPLKTKFATEKCPKNKWGEYFNKKKNGIRT